MQNKRTPSSLKIILMGELMVNIPVILVLIISMVLFIEIGLGWTLSIIAASGAGWYAWGKLLEYWKDWALKN